MIEAPPDDWRRWFAWHPVRVPDAIPAFRWLEYVWRRRIKGRWQYEDVSDEREW